MNNNELNELIYRVAQSQDKAAFIGIFDYFAPRIMGYLTSSGTNAGIAEEITQEVLTNVWQKAYQFNPKLANINTWIFTITRNKKIDRLRKNENPKYNTLDLIDALYQRNDSKNHENREILNEIQSNLTSKEKELIKMNFFEGKTHKIISQELKIPLGTVKSKIRNILKKMKNYNQT